MTDSDETKSYCYKCKREIEVNIPTVVKMPNGEEIHGVTSLDHGCGKEYLQFHCKAEDVGFTKDILDEVFESLEEGEPIKTEHYWSDIQ